MFVPDLQVCPCASCKSSPLIRNLSRNRQLKSLQGLKNCLVIIHHSNCESAKELSVYELNRTIKHFVFFDVVEFACTDFYFIITSLVKET